MKKISTTTLFCLTLTVLLASFISCGKNDDDVNSPVAQFSSSDTNTDIGVSLTFTDESLNNPTSWLWDFGDGNTSTLQNPSHSYSDLGAYSISLKVSNEYGSHTETKSNFINIDDVNELDGVWRGYEVGTDTEWEMNFAGNEFGYIAGGHEVYSGYYAVNTSNEVRQLIATVTSSSLSQYIEKDAYAIYKFNGENSIILAANKPGSDTYPADFSTGNGTRIFNLTKQE
ncbi:PKD domain-containing protein [Sunxiuqinia sp. sy24]|uniref:PKD domain-containing protein n=1 Tax=Sunxiuqinia sp. sy24 TaxID=3461495 RepID=UPI004045B402